MKTSKKSATQSIALPGSARLATLLFTFVMASAVLVQAQAPVPDSPAIEAKAHDMLGKLSLEQKIELIGGVDEMYTHAIPAIGLPRFKMSDA